MNANRFQIHFITLAENGKLMASFEMLDNTYLITWKLKIPFTLLWSTYAIGRLLIYAIGKSSINSCGL